MNPCKQVLMIKATTWMGSLLILASVVYFVASVQAQEAPRENLTFVPTMDVSRGQLIYVPIYSSIFYENGKRTLDLAATLSIHNVDPERSITVSRIDYYDSDGKLLKKYLDKPRVLKALQTTNVVIDRTDRAGGTGANFLVEWKSSESVSRPVVEGLMVNATGNLGISFMTEGKVVREVLVKNASE